MRISDWSSDVCSSDLSEWGRTISPAELVVETDSGVFRARVDHARGGRGNAMTPEDFDRKLRDCLAFSGFPQADATHAAFHAVVGRLPDCPGVSRAFRELDRKSTRLNSSH